MAYMARPRRTAGRPGGRGRLVVPDCSSSAPSSLDISFGSSNSSRRSCHALSQWQAAAEAEEVVQEGAIQVVGAVIQVVPDETEDGKNCCVNFNDSNRTILKKVAGDKLQVSRIPIP